MASTHLICIVDDQADYRFLLQQLFRRYLPAYDVRFFANGKVFLEELSQLSQHPNLILLDRHMPELDGHQTLGHLKQHIAYRKIPVVMMSADASAIEINDCYDAGVNSFLNKRMDFVEVKEVMTKICSYWLELNQEPVMST